MEQQLLDVGGALPDFLGFDEQAILPTLQQGMAAYLACLQRCLADPEPNWDKLCAPLAEQGAFLEDTWSLVEHLNAVVNSSALRQCYEQGLALITDFYTQLQQHQGLFAAYQHIAASDSFSDLEQARQRSITLALRDFKLAGVALEPAAREEFASLTTQLAKLSNQFENHVMDATDAWVHEVTCEQLAGLPETHIELAKAQAARRQRTGLCLGLDFPSYHAVMTYADDRSLRETMYQAFATRASEQGPDAGQWDNTEVMVDILKIRQQRAKLLGYEHYAAFSLETKMMSGVDAVIDFLQDLSEKSKPQAEREYQTLCEFAAQQGVETCQPWDVAYFSEQLREQQFDFSQEAVRAYFPVSHVLAGLFRLTKQLYGVSIQQQATTQIWHDDAQLFTVYDEKKRVVAQFYLDLYARPQKRGGAWMAECRQRRLTIQGDRVIPVAYLNCNFTPPVGDQEATLTHQEVLTLFHEFGHGLHHMLTTIDVVEVSGINGVAWDAVELPSQLHEQWCWQTSVLKDLSSHIETGEPLPDDLIQKMQQARSFQSAMQMQRQLEFALFDIRVHQLTQITAESIQQLLETVRGEVSVIKPPAWHRFQHSFSHIFAGGYAAGYYSYKWAEVLSSDAFSRFEEEGFFDAGVGEAFKACILSQGGSQPADVLFEAFRGRAPKVDALLRHHGIGG